MMEHLAGTLPIEEKHAILKYFAPSYEPGTLFLAEEAAYECHVKPQPKPMGSQQN